MKACATQTGFFNLRACPNQATARCWLCGRPICPAHQLSDPPKGVVCSDCRARQEEDAASPWTDTGEQWVYRYRRNYYGRTGDHPRSFFGADDYLPFTTWGADPFGWHDADDGGFADS